MRRIIAGIALPVLLIAAFAPPATTQGTREIEVQTTELADHVYMLSTGAGGNLCLCVGDEGSLLVDSEYAQLYDKVRAAVTALSDKPVRYLVNTHWHFDHVGGNDKFAASESLVLAHKNVRSRLAAGQRITIIDVDVPPAPERALPVVTFNDELTIHLGGEEINIIHIPNAHTDGDCIVLLRHANVLHTGDIVFHGGYPFIDISSGGSIDGVIAAVAKIVTLCDEKTKIIPGHGQLTNRSELEAYGAMLRQFRGIIAGEMVAGKDLDAILASRPTSKLDEIWGKRCFPPHQFTEIVYRSLEEH